MLGPNDKKDGNCEECDNCGNCPRGK